MRWASSSIVVGLALIVAFLTAGDALRDVLTGLLDRLRPPAVDAPGIEIAGALRQGDVAVARLLAYGESGRYVLSIGALAAPGVSGSVEIAVPTAVVPAGLRPEVILNGRGAPAAFEGTAAAYRVRFDGFGPLRNEADGSRFANTVVVQFAAPGRTVTPLGPLAALTLGVALASLLVARMRASAPRERTRLALGAREAGALAVAFALMTLLVPRLAPLGVGHAGVIGGPLLLAWAVAVGAVLLPGGGATLAGVLIAGLLALQDAEDALFYAVLWPFLGLLVDSGLVLIGRLEPASATTAVRYPLVLAAASFIVTVADYGLIDGFGWLPANPAALFSLHCPGLLLHCHPFAGGGGLQGVLAGTGASLLSRRWSRGSDGVSTDAPRDGRTR